MAAAVAENFWFRVNLHMKTEQLESNPKTHEVTFTTKLLDKFSPQTPKYKGLKQTTNSHRLIFYQCLSERKQREAMRCLRDLRTEAQNHQQVFWKAMRHNLWAEAETTANSGWVQGSTERPTGTRGSLVP